MSEDNNKELSQLFNRVASLERRIEELEARKAHSPVNVAGVSPTFRRHIDDKRAELKRSKGGSD